MKMPATTLYLALAAALGASNSFADAGGLPAEAAARKAADAELAARIDAEAVARMAADDELRGGQGESGLSGRYAVVGSANCLRSNAGFRSDLEFAPAVAPGSQVLAQSFTYTGTRTVDGNVMHGLSRVYSLLYPATFFQSPNSFTGGGGTVLEVTQDHAFEIGPDHTLTLTGLGSHGVFLQGSNLNGGTSDTVGAPPLTGKISQDGRTIVLTNAAMSVETATVTPPGGNPSVTPRVCTRMETMTKLAD